jgi:hypothetical protein
MKTVRMIEEAEAEFVDALAVHERDWKRKGRDLYREFIDTMREIGRDPIQFVSTDSRHQRATLPYCPYSVIYRNLPNVVWVVAIAHHKRKGGYWKKRKIPHEF